MKTIYLMISIIFVTASAAVGSPVTTTNRRPVFNHYSKPPLTSLVYLPVHTSSQNDPIAYGSDPIENVTLTVVTDNLNLDTTAHLWVQDKKGIWRFQDKNGKTMWFDSVTYCEEYTLDKGISLSDDDEDDVGSLRSSSSTNLLSPYWFGGLSSSSSLHWLADRGINQTTTEIIENPSDPGNPTGPGGSIIPNSSIQVTPAPGAILLTGMGLAFVTWVRRQRKI